MSRPIRLPILLVAVLLLVFAAADSTHAELPASIQPQLAINDGVCFGRVEIRFAVDRTYTNPFDPDEVSVQGHFKGPDGSETIVDGFYFQDFTDNHSPKDTWDHLLPKGSPEWVVRFAPTLPGAYSWWVTRHDASGSAASAPAALAIAPGTAHGFVRVAPNHTHFERDDGSAFYPMGADVAWPSKDGLFDYDRWLPLLAQNGGNAVRLWVGPLAFTLERIKVPPGGMTFDPHTGYIKNYLYPDLNERTHNGAADPWGGLGRIDLGNAWRLDYLIDLARQQGIRYMLCLEASSSLTGMWPISPYNQINGGPCAKPADFFTDPTARNFFKRRLRYLVARYGSSQQILAWEFFNEVNHFHDAKPGTVESWHQEMGAYLKQIDLDRHLVTTSDDPAMAAVPALDFGQYHPYDYPDFPAIVSYFTYKETAAYGKPFWMGETGLDAGKQKKFTGAPNYTDPTGVNLEMTYWSELACPGAGIPLPWFWETYLEQNGLFALTKPVSIFAADVPWNKVKWHQIVSTGAPLLRFVHPPSGSDAAATSLTVAGSLGGFKPAETNQPQSFQVLPDGSMEPNAAGISYVLQGVKTEPAPLHNPVTFHVTYPAAGRFSVKVKRLSPHDAVDLKIFLDDQQVSNKLFPADNAAPPQDQSIDVPAGAHTLRVSNDGPGWAEPVYSFVGFLPAAMPPLRLYAMRGDDTFAIAYIHNRDYSWIQTDAGKPLTPVAPTHLTLPGMKPGRYAVEVWAPSQGQRLSQISATADAGGVSLDLPAITTDLAIKARLLSTGL
jgi:hypothetical protein